MEKASVVCLSCGKSFYARNRKDRPGTYCSAECKPIPTNRSHGMSLTPTYRSWSTMRARCDNPNAPNYRLYGGRGIRVCERWATFEAFLADMGERPPETSLDRVDVDGDYDAANCRWASTLEQGNNRRTCRYIEAFGRRQTLSEWSRETGIAETTLSGRLDAGQAPEVALTATPKQQAVYLTFGGLTMNQKEWAKRFGLSEAAIAKRRKLGWPIERILAPPARKLPRKAA